MCIIFVILTHYNWTSDQSLKMLFPYMIYMAVPIFMVISGYVYYLSFQKNKIEHFESAYTPAFLFPKVIRYTVPFVMAMAVEFLFLVMMHKLSLSFFGGVLRGGNGPGSYYFPIMIQFLLIYPVIYFAIQKHGIKGFFACLAVNALYEFFQRIYWVDAELYRLLVLRYISVIAFGSLLASEHKGEIKTVHKIIAFFMGVVFLFIEAYTSYSPKIIIHWTGTCFLATLYILPICCFLFEKCRNVRIAPLELAGKASFNIFLTQMLFFVYAGQISGKIFANVQNQYVLTVLQNLFNILVCVIFGILFYKIENKLTSELLKSLKK
ncbi:hypothetical protein HRI96_03180 [Treponema parvum]|uniref:Acyltransferase 3 domain-containing protein n=1 Tax=Treponema parvum TaxID=138851 RepID=A0A975IDJ6_9SPIR|nr:hypothetical protein HRI96_03180 [Treponema parvum]QTQ17423.1 hypothetical protein HXT04_08775 [Treponema parvum]